MRELIKNSIFWNDKDRNLVELMVITALVIAQLQSRYVLEHAPRSQSSIIHTGGTTEHIKTLSWLQVIALERKVTFLSQKAAGCC